LFNFAFLSTVMKARILIFLVLIFSCYTLFAHSIHISVVNMDYQSDSNLITYSIRLYYDDFQDVMNKKYNTLLDLGKQNRMTTKEQECIQKYLNSVFIVQNDARETLKPVFLGWKVEDWSVWFYFRAKVVDGLKRIDIENKILLEVFIDQKNLMIFRKSGNEKGFEFNHRITSQSIEI
jgi:hypothetical protein